MSATTQRAIEKAVHEDNQTFAVNEFVRYLRILEPQAAMALFAREMQVQANDAYDRAQAEPTTPLKRKAAVEAEMIAKAVTSLAEHLIRLAE